MIGLRRRISFVVFGQFHVLISSADFYDENGDIWKLEKKTAQRDLIILLLFAIADGIISGCIKLLPLPCGDFPFLFLSLFSSSIYSPSLCVN